jgi:quinol-cytochrome oxidoreductase complex cytochrome b subunit
MSFTSLVSVHLPTVIAVINQDPSLSTLEHFSSSSEPKNSSDDHQKKEMTKKLVDYNKKHPIMFFLYLILNVVFVLVLLYFMFFAIDLALHCPILPKWLTIITLLILFFSNSQYSLLFLILYLILIISIARRYECTDNQKIMNIDVVRIHENVFGSPSKSPSKMEKKETSPSKMEKTKTSSSKTEKTETSPPKKKSSVPKKEKK